MRKPPLLATAAAGATLAASLVLAAAVPPASAHGAAEKAAATSQVSASTLLADLKIHGHSHTSTYQRSKFKLWIDADHDGENTRAEVLVRQSSIRVKENTHHTVETGKWISPYDGKKYSSASKLQIDHLVPLENAWISGAATWTAEKREAYANDLGYTFSLIAVSSSQNEKKNDDDPSKYLPPKKSYDCRYVESWIAVKYRWGLSVTTSERAVLQHDLRASCTTAASRKIARPGKPNLAVLVGTPSSSKPVMTATPVPSASPTETPTPTSTPAPVEPVTPAPTPTSVATPPSNYQGVVHPGAFCSPAGATGVTSAGTPMVCGPGSDGRNRWHAG